MDARVGCWVIAVAAESETPRSWTVEDWAGVGLMVAMLTIMGLQVCLRYVFGTSLAWSEELSRYLLIYMVYLGAAVGVRNRSHIRIDIIDTILSTRLASALRRIVDILVLVYLVYVAFEAVQVARVSWQTPSPALRVSMGWFILAITIGFGAAALRLVAGYLPARR